MENLDYLLFMQSIVQHSNQIALKYFDNIIEAEYKDDDSPVTIADKEIELFLREKIHQTFPDHAIIGEELEDVNRGSEYCWVIDPIDGTKNFAASIPCFATLIALCRDSKPILGCISAPAMHKIWTGGEGEIARCNGQPIQSRNCQTFDKAWFSYTAPSVFSEDQRQKIQKIEQQTQVNIYGNDAIAYALIAQGRLDLVIENGLKPWDFAALIPIIEASGGVVTDFQSRPIDLMSDGSFIGAGTKELHQLAVLAMNSSKPNAL